MTEEEQKMEKMHLFEILTRHSKAKEYAKEIDNFFHTGKMSLEEMRTIAILSGVGMIIRDIANLVEVRHQRGIDGIIREAGDKWKSVVRNSTVLKIFEPDALLLLVDTCGVLSPELGAEMSKQFNLKLIE